jgi:hypothetical protein
MTLRRWIRWTRQVSHVVTASGLVPLAARVGYGARGAVYISVGTIAVLAALRLAPHAQGAEEALRVWARWPIGIGLLWVTALGLCGFALWRALQSVLDIERLGWRAKGLAARVGKAVSGLLYGGLGVAVLQFLDALRDFKQGDDQAATVASIQATLSLPFGRGMVVGLGLILAVTGLGNIARAFVDHFTAKLASAAVWNTPIGILARSGYLARGLAFVPAGYLTMKAGWHANAGEAVSIGRSMDLFKTQSHGHALLAAEGCGLIAFGVFGVAKALLRHLPGQDHKLKLRAKSDGT